MVYRSSALFSVIKNRSSSSEVQRRLDHVFGRRITSNTRAHRHDATSSSMKRPLHHYMPVTSAADPSTAALQYVQAEMATISPPRSPAASTSTQRCSQPYVPAASATELYAAAQQYMPGEMATTISPCSAAASSYTQRRSHHYIPAKSAAGASPAPVLSGAMVAGSAAHRAYMSRHMLWAAMNHRQRQLQAMATGYLPLLVRFTCCWCVLPI